MSISVMLSAIETAIDGNTIFIGFIGLALTFLLRRQATENTRQLDMAKLIYSAEAEEKKVLRERMDTLKQHSILANNECMRFREEAQKAAIACAVDIEKLRNEVALLTLKLHPPL